MIKQKKEPLESIRIERQARRELKKARKFQSLDKIFEGEKEHKYLTRYAHRNRNGFIPIKAASEEKNYFRDRDTTSHLSDRDLRTKNAKSCDRRSFYDDPFQEKLHELTFSLDNGKRRLSNKSKDAIHQFWGYWDEKFDNRALSEKEYSHIVEAPLPELMKEAIETGERICASLDKEDSRQYNKKLYVNYLSIQLQNPRTFEWIKEDIIRHEHETKPKRQQRAIQNKRLAQIFIDCRKETGLVDLTSAKRYPFREISEYVEPLFQKTLNDPVPESIELYHALRTFFQDEARVVFEKCITANWNDERFRDYCTELYLRKHTVGGVADYVERKDPVYAKLSNLAGRTLVKGFAYGTESRFYASDLMRKMRQRKITEAKYTFLAKASQEELIRDAREKYQELLAESRRPCSEDYRPEIVCITPRTLALQNLKAKKLKVNTK